jgi:hypothetical protein
VVRLAGALFVLALIWCAIRLGGPPECDSSSPRIAIGEVMLVAGCTQRQR